MLESKFQRKVIEEVERMFPDCVIIKTDPTYIWSFPDLVVFIDSNYAVLETKRRADSDKQPNQGYYVGLLDDMSFSRFINQDNFEEVMDELARAFKT